MNNDHTYNPLIHHRRSVRLKDYDYSSQGLYFITICVQDKKCLFGKIENDEMKLNAAGKMIMKWWAKVPEKFPDIILDEFIIMPNHFHAIVENTGAKSDEVAVGANPRVRPEDRIENAQTDKFSTQLYYLVQWFKTMSTNEYIRNVKNIGWEPFDKKVWQRSYHEHIIRDQKSYQKISEYIKSNPSRWEQDKFFMTDKLPHS